MKLITFLLLLLLPTTLPALYCVTDCETDWKLDVRVAYYQMTSKKISQIYSRNWVDYQIEASWRVRNFCELWTGVYWANRRGEGQQFSYGFKDSTKMYILPLCIGAKFIYPIFPCAEAYVGAGFCYSFLRINNHCKEHYYHWGLSSSPFKTDICKSNYGGIAKVGLQIALCKNMFIDIFADYISQRFRLSHRERKHNDALFHGNIDCSGFKFGGGLGVYF